MKNRSKSSAEPTVFIANVQTRSAQAARRSLLHAGFSVQAGAPKAAQITLRKLGVYKCLEHPDPSLQPEKFKNWLLRLFLERDNLIILPIHEAILHICDEVRAGQPDFRCILPSHQSLVFALSKYRSTQAALDVGLSIPSTIFVREPDTHPMQIGADRLQFPCIIKWDNSISADDTRYEKGSLKVVHSFEEARDVLAEIKPRCCGVIAQELVRGYGVGAFFLRHQGKVVLRFAHRRIHEVPWPGGVSGFCEVSNDEEVLAAGEKLLEAIGYEGVAMVEFRKEPGKPPVFLEINGRLWGSLGLAMAADANFPRAMLECYLHGKTRVKQPDLSRRVRWHDPGLEMDFLRSLWRKKPGPMDGPVPKLAGSIRVLVNFLNPLVQSDWWDRGKPSASLKRYARLWRRELALLKANTLSKFKPVNQDLLVASAVERTRRWRGNPGKPREILFLCYGNICRSPYAMQRWNAWKIERVDLAIALSSGFHENMCRETPLRFQSAARQRGVELKDHRSSCLDQELVDTADWIFAMDARNLQDLERKFPEALEKTLLLGAIGDEGGFLIPDPYGKIIGTGGQVYRRMDRELEKVREIISKAL